MQPGQISTTAQYVAYSRALGDLAPQVPGFADPVAAQLLPEAWAGRLARARRRLDRAPGDRAIPIWMRGMVLCNQFRTVMLDRAIRAALPLEQLAVLGAGLDGRAWRMPELAATTVFELDHPATQAWKRAKAAALPPVAREVRFVPVEFAGPAAADPWPERLRAAGFRPDTAAFWLCEGVLMYLSPRETQALFTAMAGLSAPGSRLALTYMGRKNGRPPGGLVPNLLSLLGEPLRSAHEPETLDRAAAAGGWRTLSDTGIADWRPALTPELTITEKQAGFQGHERIWLGERA
jgi:methyltransferase (TIGR00027 family)